uniref:TPR_REGION domain-containing protein n=1 Tax=Angiostrongylus cantonensis TaxID=6313 RepID=A0A0K0DR73_ANGCA
LQDHENARSVEEDIELEPPLRRIKRKKNRIINRGDKVDKSPLVLAKHTLVDVDNGSDDDDGDDVDNNNSSDDENDNNNSINNDIGDDGDSANDNNIKAEEVGQERGNVYKTQILDEKREHSHRKEIKDSENGIGDETDAFEGLRYRRRRSHFSRHLTDVVSERECKRKHCPPLYQAEPRRSLLKTKHKAASNIVIRAKNKVDDRDHDQGGDYENNEADDEVVVQLNEKNTEVVSLSRYRSSGRETYKRQAITNRDDHKNRNLLDRADSLVEKHNYDAAFTIYNAILRSRPNSPRAHFGKGRAYQLRGEMTSNDIEFIRAIQEYEYVLQNEETPNALFREAALRLIELASFRGDFYRCLLIHGSLVDRFPDEVQHRMNVALTFIKMKRFKDAKKVLHDVCPLYVV